MLAAHSRSKANFVQPFMKGSKDSHRQVLNHLNLFTNYATKEEFTANVISPYDECLKYAIFNYC